MARGELRGAFMRPLLDLAAFSAGTNILLLVAPLYMLQVYDRVLPTGNFDTLISLSILAALGLAVLGALEVLRSFYATRLAARIDAALGDTSFMNAMTGAKAAIGDISPIRDLMTVRNFVASRSLFFLFDLPFTPLFLLVLFFIHPWICVLTILGALAMVAIAIFSQAWTAGPIAGANEHQNRSMILAQSFGRSFDTVVALGMVGKVSNIWGNAFAESSLSNGRVAEANALFGGVARILRMAIQMAILGLGAYLVLTAQITAGMIFASTMIAGRALQPLDQITGGWRQIADARQAFRRVRAQAGPVEGTGQTLQLAKPQGSLVVSDLVYALPGAAPEDPPLIRGVSFNLAAGETLSIIGPNRAGKSTLARLLVGGIRPKSGTVRLEGVNIHQASSDFIGRSVGYLPQDSELFPGTIAQNIARFDINLDSAKIIGVARAAGAHEIILAQGKGYETYVGPGGARLSGGERQRVALARALYGDPNLLVLDEPNANLDAEGDFWLDQAITQSHARGRTVIVITHRPALASKCDKILVLTNGRISAFGPSRAVLAQMSGGSETPASVSNASVSR